MTLPSYNFNDFDKHKASKFISDLKNELGFEYIYAITISKVPNIKFHDVDDTSVKAFLYSLLKNTPIFNLNSNDFHHCNFKVINNNDDSHFEIVHMHGVLLCKNPISWNIFNRPIKLNNKSVMIKDITNLDGWISYIYDKHEILNFNHGTYKKTTIIHRAREHLKNVVNIFIADFKNLFQIPITPVYIAFYFCNIKFMRGTYELYTDK